MISKYNRIESLDGIRGISCLVIVLFHCHFPISFISYGYLAVEIFVCLSGFLMAYKYKNTLADIDFLDYFSYRYFKLMPLYWITDLCVCFWYVILYFYKGSNLLFDNLSLMLLEFSGFYTGFFSIERMPLNEPLWVVCCMLFCYIIYYIICKISNQSDNKYLLLLGGALLLCISIRVNDNYNHLIFNRPMFRVLISFIMGCIIYEFYLRASIIQGKQITGVYGFILFIIILVGALNKSGEFIVGNNIYIMTDLFICPLLILSALYIIPIKRFLMSKVIQFFGKISMSIYFWQGTIYIVLRSRTFTLENIWIDSIYKSIVVLAVSIFAHYHIEPYINAIFSKFVRPVRS